MNTVFNEQVPVPSEQSCRKWCGVRSNMREKLEHISLWADSSLRTNSRDLDDWREAMEEILALVKKAQA